jgi:uncharacterized protein YdiU (UPF0061 family)
MFCAILSGLRHNPAMIEDNLPAGLTALEFDNSFVRQLPGDPQSGSQRRQITNALFSRVNPVQTARPQLLAWSKELADQLGLSDGDVEDPAFAEIFSGNCLLPGMDPYASCYGGHQFGNWAGQLGDGRAINLGEVKLADGGRMTLQLKGAGPTPYSRTADGLAVLRSSLREFLCSEAMHHLGVPTTRALSLVTTGESVVRDMLYDGHPAAEPGAVVCRVAPSFTRFGHFQMLAARQENELLQQFVDYTVSTDFPHLLETASLGSAQLTLALFAEVCARTAEMVAHWMRVGFVHGVMNTDNMSVLGLTIDYGPYGWLEDYDPDWTPNTTDAGSRRYRFGYQPAVAQWNLLQLANALHSIVPDVPALEGLLKGFETSYTRLWLETMAAKLGLTLSETGTETESDLALFQELDRILQLTETDMTLFYRLLAEVSLDPVAPGTDPLAPLMAAYYQPQTLTAEIRSEIQAWLDTYLQRCGRDAADPDTRWARMNAVNPLYVPRNYLAQLAIDQAEQGDPTQLKQWLDVLRKPYDEQPGQEAFAARRPEWARSRVGCSQLSCSS